MSPRFDITAWTLGQARLVGLREHVWVGLVQPRVPGSRPVPGIRGVEVEDWERVDPLPLSLREQALHTLRAHHEDLAREAPSLALLTCLWIVRVVAQLVLAAHPERAEEARRAERQLVAGLVALELLLTGTVARDPTTDTAQEGV